MVGAVIGLADADAKAFVVDGLVRALLDGLPALEGDVAAHLRRHRRQRQHVLPTERLLEARRLLLLLAAERRDRQLENAAGRLRCLLARASSGL